MRTTSVTIDKSQLAFVLEAARTRAGLTQEQLAKLINFSRSAIAMVEAGEREPTLQMLREWGRVTGHSELIAIVSKGYIGEDHSGLVGILEENVRLRTVVGLMKAGQFAQAIG